MGRWGLAILLAMVLGCGARSDLKVGELPGQCYDVSFEGQGVRAQLRTDARLRRADVMFLIDSTASMDEEIAAIQRRLREEVIPRIDATFSDVEYGVASFADFPNGINGGLGDVAFSLQTAMTADLSTVQAALGRLPASDGIDAAESQVEALYQLATGEGLPPYIGATRTCTEEEFGAACFRTEAKPVVLLFTDAPFHDSAFPLADNLYDLSILRAVPHTYAETIAALSDERIAVIGIWSGGPVDHGRQELIQLTRDTGALDGAGGPLVFDIGEDGRGLSTTVVDAISTFAESSKFDVSVEVEDMDPDDGIDVEELIVSIRPVSANPMSGVDGVDGLGRRFLGVKAGTEVTFEIEVNPSLVAPPGAPRRFPVLLHFRGDDRFDVGEQVVHVVIAGSDGDCGEAPDDVPVLE